MSVLDRVVELCEYKGFTIKSFEKEMGFSNASISAQVKKNGTIGADRVEKILLKYPEVSPSWLILGVGDMLASPSAQMLPATPETGIPLIPVDAMAGWLTGEVQFSPDDIAYYSLPNFRGADFIIKVKGDSMQPKYYSGDLAVCKKLPLSDLFFQWGKTYVLDTDQGALIKRIDKGESKETISLVSYNREYAPFELHRSSIHNVALVMGIIREE